MAAEMHTEAPAQPAVAEKPTGPAAAVTAAGGIGVFFLGLFTTLNEAFAGVHEAMDWHAPSGPLSGKSSVGTMAFFVSWALLGALWRRASVPLKPVLIATGVLVALGVMMTFPDFFTLFAEE